MNKERTHFCRKKARTWAESDFGLGLALLGMVASQYLLDMRFPTALASDTHSGFHTSSDVLFTRVRCVPKRRCKPLHRQQKKMPSVMEAHGGERAWHSAQRVLPVRLEPRILSSTAWTSSGAQS